jgi:hypothetical protein
MQNAKTIDLRTQISSLVEEYKRIAFNPTNLPASVECGATDFTT